jgi:hypothetical protein
MSLASDQRFFGITVLADFILNEGVDGVLDNLTERAGVTAVALNPTVTAESEEGNGSFQPPTDAGSSPRLFDRPLWGKRSLWVRSGPSYYPDESLYSDTPYRPRQPNDLTKHYGDVIGDFIDAALERGLKVYFQLSGTAPPGLRDEDRPLLPDGRPPANRMADTASLASDAVRSYITAHVHDLLAKYPRITGFRPDWPEYPCYKLDEAFQDFSPAVQAWAERNGEFDFDSIRRDVGAFYRYLHGGLTNADLETFIDADPGELTELALVRDFPHFRRWLQLKSALSVDLLQHWRRALTEWGGEELELSANAFMPPFSLFTGFDFAAAASCCSAASPKLYTMHWTVIVEFWGRILLDRNPGLDEGLLVKALAHLFDLGDRTDGTESLADYHYPEPDEPHPVSAASQSRKIDLALAQAGAGMAITPIVHGYGPPDDFLRRFRIVAESRAHGIWINRYGYLSDEKLEGVGEIWRSSRTDG